MYIYPDKNDGLTVALISEISDWKYWDESEEEVFKYAFDALKKRDNVKLLDVGCGLGRLFSVFAPYAKSICALEPDRQRYEGAVKSAEAMGDYPIEVHNCDISSLDNGEEFDAVIISHVLQHIPTEIAEIMVDNISKKLKKGGCVIVTTTHTASSEDMLTVEYFENDKRVCVDVTEEEFEKNLKKDGILPVRMFAEKTVIDLFAKYGFNKLAQKRYYHYYATNAEQTVENDISRNAVNDGKDARDILYIFERD